MMDRKGGGVMGTGGGGEEGGDAGPATAVPGRNERNNVRRNLAETAGWDDIVRENAASGGGAGNPCRSRGEDRPRDPAEGALRQEVIWDPVYGVPWRPRPPIVFVGKKKKR